MRNLIINQQVYFSKMTEVEKKDPDVVNAVLRLHQTRSALEKLMMRHVRENGY